MPRSYTLFMPGYTPSYGTEIPGVLRGDFRIRGADSAPEPIFHCFFALPPNYKHNYKSGGTKTAYVF